MCENACKREEEFACGRIRGYILSSDAIIFFAFRIWVVHFLFDPRRGGVGVDPISSGSEIFGDFSQPEKILQTRSGESYMNFFTTILHSFRDCVG